MMESGRRKVGVSTQKLARRYRVPHMTVQREIKRNEMAFKRRRQCTK